MILLYILFGVLLIISILMIHKKIKPNGLVGIRMGKAVWNEENWYRANEFSGWIYFITSLTAIIFLLSLQIYKQFYLPELNILLPGVIGATIFAIIGTAISIVHSLSMPDSHTEGDKFDTTPLKSNYAITIYVWISILLIIGVLPLAFNRVEPNNRYGYKTSKTLASEENWYKMNQFAARSQITASCAAIFSILFLKFFLAKNVVMLNSGILYLVLFLLPHIVSFIVSFIYHMRL